MTDFPIVVYALAPNGIDEVSALVHPNGAVEFSRIEFIGNATWEDGGLSNIEPPLDRATIQELTDRIKEKAGNWFE